MVDRNATEARVRKAERPSVLHLATHGIFRHQTLPTPKQPLSELDAVAQDMAFVRHVRSLSQSGLALSGINNGGINDGDDGVLTAFDVCGMDLLGTDLVVMSACDTRLGDTLAGEGVLRLRRSFRIAGARYVAMSLWPVSDKETKTLMRDFYTAYRAGADPVLALRDQQLAVIGRLRTIFKPAPSPQLWAAFTIEGA